MNYNYVAGVELHQREERKTDRQKDRQKDRQTETDRE